jgi:hypothetical protein
VSPRSRAHTLVFTAALVQARAQAVPASSLFECSAAEAAEALGERRRQATAHVAPERAARALG